jgi:hypothetical protein
MSSECAHHAADRLESLDISCGPPEPQGSTSSGGASFTTTSPWPHQSRRDLLKAEGAATLSSIDRIDVLDRHPVKSTLKEPTPGSSTSRLDVHVDHREGVRREVR